MTKNDKKDLLIIFAFSLISVIILIIHYPPIAIKAFYLIGLLLSIVVFGLSIITITKKKIPDVFAKLLRWFIFYSYYVYLISIRTTVDVKVKIDEVPIGSRFVNIEFPNNIIISGILYLLIFLIAVICLIKIKNYKYEKTMKLTLEFQRCFVFSIIIILPLIIIADCSVGFYKLNFGIKEAFFFYLPYILAHGFIYFIPVMISCLSTFLVVKFICKNSVQEYA